MKLSQDTQLKYFYKQILYYICSTRGRKRYNIIAETLSWWHFLTIMKLTTFLRVKSISQLPTYFRILPLLQEIKSRTISMFQRLQKAMEIQMTHINVYMEHGDDRSSSYKDLNSTETPTLLSLHWLSETYWLPVLQYTTHIYARSH